MTLEYFLIFQLNRNKSHRKELEELREEQAESNAVYREARQLSHTFRDGLLDFFFDSKSGMENLTKNYGVF